MVCYLKILIVTGRLAAEIVRKTIASIKGYKIDVYVLPIEIIGLARVENILSNISRRDVEGYDYLLVPGLVRGDLRVLEEKLGVRVIKGPKSLELLKPLFIIGPEKFRPDKDAEEIIIENLEKIFTEAKEYYEKRIDKYIRIDGIKLPYSPPPLRIGYVFEKGYGLNWAKKYLTKYKPDILMLPPRRSCRELMNDYLFITENKLLPEGGLGVPWDRSLLNECKGLYEEASLIYNIPLNDLDYAEKLGVPLVVYVDDARKMDMIKDKERIIIDFGLDPLTRNLFRKIREYEAYKDKFPLAAWLSNVSYSIDVDSHGVYAILMDLLMDAGVGLQIVWEFEDKLRWSLMEAVIIRDMLQVARRHGVLPRDIGFDLLLVKDKIYYEIPLKEYDKVVEARKKEFEGFDPMGIFRISVDMDEGVIKALYIGRKGKILIKGRNCEEIRDTILRLELVSKLSHAFYLGGELCRAEEALRLGKKYEQEKHLFKDRLVQLK